MSTGDNDPELPRRYYRVRLHPNAAKALDVLDEKVFKQIDGRILELEANPRPTNCRKLSGPPHNLYRIRSGRYRIIYSVNDTESTILVVAIRKRDEATYRDI